MLGRWQGRTATVLVVGVTAVLVVLDLTDEAFRSWWAARPLTTDVTAGLLVLLITVLVVDQVVRFRQIKDRARAVAAQAAIVTTQGRRTASAVTSALDGSADRDDALEETRTYMTMLLIAAPLLIDVTTSRVFLESAQRLAGELARALVRHSRGEADSESSAQGIDAAVAQMRSSAEPLLEILRSSEREAATGGDT